MNIDAFMLELESYCKQLDFVLVIDFALGRVYVRDPGKQQDIAMVSRRTWQQAVWAMTHELLIRFDLEMYTKK